MAKLDKYDLEAEREGAAVGKFRKEYSTPSRGKRIMKIRRGHQNGNTKIETRIDKRYVTGDGRNVRPS